MTDSNPQDGFTLVIEAGRPEARYWRDLWSYRGLIFFFAWRDIVVRYKQTLLGVAWVLLRPLATIVILTVVFGKLAALPSGDVPYALMVLDRKSTRLNSSHIQKSRMPSSA